MNLSSIIGVAAALVVFFVAIFTSTSAWGIFLDPHGILIVVGGTIAASLICFKLSIFVKLSKLFVTKIMGKETQKYEILISEIVMLAKGYRENSNFLKENAANIKTFFLKEALDLTIQGGISSEFVDEILEKRAQTHFKRYEDEASIFKIIGKFPPAFGLMGTTLGMISLLQKMGSPDSYKTLGPSMAIGLVATLYGIAITNLILIPMGENLSQLNKEDAVLRQIVMDGIRLLRRKEHPIVIEEFLMSYLLPKEREVILRKAA